MTAARLSAAHVHGIVVLSSVLSTLNSLSSLKLLSPPQFLSTYPIDPLCPHDNIEQKRMSGMKVINGAGHVHGRKFAPPPERPKTAYGDWFTASSKMIKG